jgi:hypothetical protein
LGPRGPDDRGRLPGSRVALLSLIFFCTAVAVAGQGAAARDPGAPFLKQAQDALSRRDWTGALDAVRTLRARYPGSPAVPDALAVAVQASLGTGDEYRARYFNQALTDGARGSSAAFHASLSLAAWFYERRAWDDALAFYTACAAGFQVGTTGSRADLARVLLRAAELSWYHDNNADAARGALARITAADLTPAEAGLFRELRIRLLWSVLDPAALGLKDGNVSSLRVDGDDLWVGTWNGGASRYSISSAHADPFPNPAFTRSIEVADRRVWVATSEGLSWYGKTTGRWGSEGAFGGDSPMKVQAVRRAGAALYAGTLGDGLFLRTETAWQPVSDGVLPGRFITTLAEDVRRHRLLIGTLATGMVIMDLATGGMRQLSDLAPAFSSPNITTILPAADGRIWIGTYGDGLSVWDPDANTIHRYSKDTGEIGDDWVLASVETDRGLYFGTFGGGVSTLPHGSRAWRTIGIADGLAALDITAIEWRAPFLFFGTLGAGVSVYDEAADGAQL